MKKFIKICLIAGGVCILIGGGITATAAALGGNLQEVMPRRAVEWRKEISGVDLDGFWENFDDGFAGEDFEDYYDQIYTDTGEKGQEIFSSAEIKKLDIEARAGKIVFAEDPSGDRIRIFCNRDETHWSIKPKEDELKLKVYPGDGGIGDESGLLVTIFVPEDYHFASVNLKLNRSNRMSDRKVSAPLMIAQSLSADEMDLETKVGAIKINGGSAGDLDIVSDVGAVDFSGVTSGDIDAKSRVGAIRLELTGRKEDYNYEIQCSLGAVKIGEESIAALKNKKKVNNGAGKKMDLECETGAIQVDFINDL